MVEVKETVAHAVCIARPLTDLFLIASHSRQSVVDIAMMDREMERESLVGQDYQRDRRDERCKIVLSYAWIGCRACLFVLSMVVVVRELRTNRGTSTMDGVVRHATKGADANVSLSDADGKVKGMLGCNHLNLKVFPYGTYCGPLIDGVPDTRNNSAWQGTMWYSGGSQYEGQWKNGKMNGWGQLKASNGDVYSGHFRDGMKDGRFDFTQQSGEKLIVEYKNDKIVRPSSGPSFGFTRNIFAFIWNIFYFVGKTILDLSIFIGKSIWWSCGQWFPCSAIESLAAFCLSCILCLPFCYICCIICSLCGRHK